MTRRTLLIGATGMFGSRLARMLAQMPGIDLIVTSRSGDRAKALARTLRQDASRACRISDLAFTHGQGADATFTDVKPWLVIDAAGPFQHANYDTAIAALTAGAHWIDLADAASYIDSFVIELDELARRNGVTAVSGASSTPALSFAAIQALTDGWRSVDKIEIGIYPAGRSAVGEAVLRAVLSYTGSPVAIWREGQPSFTTGWGTAEKLTLTGMPHRYRSPVATYDYALLSRTFAARDVSFYAGLESPIEHLGLTILAELRARRLLPRLEPLAPLLHMARRLTAPSCGSTGGMTVEVTGRGADGQASSAVWTLLARDGDGPNVPVLPALALARKLLREPPVPGAFCAAGTISLDEIVSEMTGLAISTSSSVSRAAGDRAKSPRIAILAA